MIDIAISLTSPRAIRVAQLQSNLPLLALVLAAGGNCSAKYSAHLVTIQLCRRRHLTIRRTQCASNPESESHLDRGPLCGVGSTAAKPFLIALQPINASKAAVVLHPRDPPQAKTLSAAPPRPQWLPDPFAVLRSPSATLLSGPGPSAPFDCRLGRVGGWLWFLFPFSHQL